ncbi:dipeptidase [Microbacterium aerolatum]|uniref:dipeptidase n=1 Tax=Microbacterium aerolatum TaxID=153731 RepID=UPI00384EA1DC
MRIADCHNDLLMAVQHQYERGMADPFGEIWLPQLKEGGVQLQVLPVYTEEQYIGEGALRRCLLLIEQAHALAERHSTDVAIAGDRRRLDEIIASGRIALVLALEGGEPIGANLELIPALFRVGIRMASLTWNRRTMMADGAAESDTGGRLTALGRDSVAELERCGIIVDVSHLSEPGFWHVAEVATRPFIASHSSARALHDHPRNLTDEQLRQVAVSGGIVCLNAYGGFLGAEPSIELYMDHISHVIDVIGIDHVALGPDFIREVNDIVDPALTGPLFPSRSLPLVADLASPRDLPRLAARLIERLGHERAERVCRGTLTEFLLRNLPEAS